MRIAEVHATDILPVRRFDATELADVVVLAGPNGVGKTRLIDGVVSAFLNPLRSPKMRLVIEATSESEVAAWEQRSLNTAVAGDAQKLTRTLQQNRQRASWKSSVVQFESDRSIQQIQQYSFGWDYTDPFTENFGWDSTFAGLRSRFQDTLHSLFRKVKSHRESISRDAIQLRASGATTMPLDWPDPLAAFKDAFNQLLAPKRLRDPDPQRQQLEYEVDGQVRPVSTLSSGEREVVNIVFDFLLRNPQDCVVLFDEPELHLHPELSYRLLQTMRNVGKRNQFIFCTHSPDIITASLDQSVLFVAPASDPPINQAIAVRAEDETNQALQLLGQSIGIIALGRRLVFIEGSDASLDKQTYGTILRNRFPDLVLVPTGGKGLVRSFDRLIDGVLGRTLWGVEFFMLCDGDAFPYANEAANVQTQSSGRMRLLPRYHLENYFLDESVLAAVFARMEPDNSWLRDPQQIATRMRDIAGNQASYAVALMVSAEIRQRVGNVDVMPSGVHSVAGDDLVRSFQAAVSTERSRITAPLEASVVSNLVRDTEATVRASIESSDAMWKRLIPGRPVFNTFASQVQMKPGRLRQLYLAEVEARGFDAFADIIAIFEQFSALPSASIAAAPPDGTAVTTRR